MDYQIFSRQLSKAIKEEDIKYPFKDVLSIFIHYFERYKAYMHRDHPPIKTSKLIDILYCIVSEDFDVEDYCKMIDLYFDTSFDCDRNICHFFSGDIIQNRFYELYY